MRTIYRTTFELRPGSSSTTDHFHDFAERVWMWIYDRRELGLTHRAPEHRAPDHAGPVTLTQFSPKEGFRIESLHVDTPERRGWSLLLQQADTGDATLFWVSDLALVREADGRYYFSFMQSLGRQDGGMTPFRRTPGRPRIMRTLVRDFIAASGGIRLHSKPCPLRLRDEDLGNFIQILESPTRTHPVVLVSVHEQSKSYLINPHDLADHLSGIAHVIVAESSMVAQALSYQLPRWLTCYDGAIRVYWPGFKRASQTIDHRLWTVNELSADPIHFDSGRFADAVLAAIAEVSVSAISPHFSSFDRVQSLDRRRVIAAALDNKDWKQLADTYAADADAKELRISELERLLKEAGERLFREQQLTTTLRARLESQKQGDADTAENEIPAQSVQEAISRARAAFPNQLSFRFNQSSEDDKSPYRYPEEVWLAFDWLATTYHQARTKTKSCPDFDASIRKAVSGWTYSGHQNESTMKANKAWYQCVAEDGRKLWVPEHLRSGNGRDAEEAIRIAFTWDESTQRIVIGYIGQHQRNSRTN
jgi:hypothetical protein